MDFTVQVSSDSTMATDRNFFKAGHFCVLTLWTAGHIARKRDCPSQSRTL